MENRTASLSKRLLALLLSILMVVGLLPAMVWAADEVDPATGETSDAPDHDKLRYDNGDGTYTLELTVTGDAVTEKKITGAVNVMVIFDTSNSMVNNDTTFNDASVRLRTTVT